MATRGKEVQDFIKAQKKTARQRFEEAGFKIFRDNEQVLIYWLENEELIKRVIFEKDFEHYSYADSFGSLVDMETLKLIIAQCKEFGWLR